MFLGVLWHVVTSYPERAWPQPGVSDELVAWIGSTSHAFRLPLFFLLAGFFAAMVRQRAGGRAFVRVRAVRIGIPLAVGLVTIAPLTALAWSYASGLPLLEGRPLGTFVSPYHLWFLEFLIVYYAVALGLERIVRDRPAAVRAGDRAVDLVVRSRGRLLWCAAAGTAVIAVSSRLGAIELTVVQIGLSHLAQYGLFFGVGWLLWARRDRLDEIGRSPGRWAIVALVASIARVAMVHAGWELTATLPEKLLLHATTQAIAWSAVFALFGYAERLFARERRGIRYATDSVFWIYLVHLPIVIAGRRLLDDSALPWAAQALVLLTVAVGVSLASYALLVRHTVIGRVLHGPRERPSARRGARDELGQPSGLALDAARG